MRAEVCWDRKPGLAILIQALFGGSFQHITVAKVDDSLPLIVPADVDATLAPVAVEVDGERFVVGRVEELSVTIEIDEADCFRP